MLTASAFPIPAARQATADAELAPDQATDMERLSLALLRLAAKCEVEAGLILRITPTLPVASLAKFAGVEEERVAGLLDYLLEAGFLAHRRQRLVLTRPEALCRLALGAPPV
jgi:hypothetical protein